MVPFSYTHLFERFDTSTDVVRRKVAAAFGGRSSTEALPLTASGKVRTFVMRDRSMGKT